MKRISLPIVLLLLLAACVPASGEPVATISPTFTPFSETPAIFLTASPTLYETPVPDTPDVVATTPAPLCTPPPCAADEVYHCPGDCPGGCGTVCVTVTPPRPGDFGSAPTTWDDLLGWLTNNYANSVPAGQVRDALLAAGWITGESDWGTADFTGNGRVEWVMLLYAPETGEEEGGYPANVWVVGDGGLTYRHSDEPIPAGFSLQLQLLAVRNVTDDDLPELIINEESCGAHTCFTGIRAISFRGGLPQNIVRPDDPEAAPMISVSYADVHYEDATADGITDILVNGGAIGSAGAGIVRTYTEIWAWNPDVGALTLADIVLDPTEFRHHILYEANERYNAGDLDTARALYEQAVNDADLITPEFMTTPEETYAAIEQFAAFRLMLIDLQEGVADSAAGRLAMLQETYPDAPLTAAAATLLANWSSPEDLPALCGVIAATLQTYASPTGGLEYLGYGNPSLTAVHVCPHG